jgi:hypothetical protein
MKDEKKSKEQLIRELAEMRERITQMKASEAELMQVEKKIGTLKQQLEYVLGVTKTGLDIIDSNFNIRYIDPEWQKIYGEPKGKKCFEYFMGRSEVCRGCGIIKALQTKKLTLPE